MAGCTSQVSWESNQITISSDLHLEARSWRESLPKRIQSHPEVEDLQMSDNQKIPFLDLVGLHEEIEKELVPVFQKTLRTAGFIGGPMVEGFERDFVRFCDTAHCLGVGSGTDAVRFALMAAGVQPGDM